MDTNRLNKQLTFLKEIDLLKNVFRKAYLLDQKRKENSAEHSWHTTLMALIFSEYANDEVNILHVLKMLLIHDIVEIDVGDTFLYDKIGKLTQSHKEKQAAKRIFALLPEDQAKDYLKIWLEFEENITKEAKFARAVDRIMPILHNYFNQGKSWKEFNVKKTDVLKNKSIVSGGSTSLWKYINNIIEDSDSKGYFNPV